MNPIKILTLAGGAATVLVLGAATPASAYAGPVYHGSDYAQTINRNDDIIQVCDREADGNGVYTEYYLNNGAFGSLGDGNGSASPCYIRDYTATAYWVNRFRVCESGVGCSGWRYTDGLGGN